MGTSASGAYVSPPATSLRRNSPEDAGRRTKQVKGKGFAKLSEKERRKSRPEEYAPSKKTFSPTIGRLSAQVPGDYPEVPGWRGLVATARECPSRPSLSHEILLKQTL